MPEPTNSISITPHCIRICRKAGSGISSFLRDGDFPGGQSFRDFIRGFLASIRTTALLEDKRAGMRAVEVVVSDSHLVYGRLQAGKYGFEAVLENIETNSQKKREMKDCEYIPFFYTFAFKSEQSCAILLMEQFGPYSAKGSLLRLLQKHIKNQMADCYLEHGTIVNEKYVKESIRQSVKAFRFIWKNIPQDLADNILPDDAEDSEGTMELSVRPRRGLTWPMTEWVNWGGHSTCGGVAVCGESFDDLKIDVEIGGKKRTVRADKLSCFRMSFDVTLKVRLGNDGHPTMPSMLRESKDIIDIARKTIGWANDDQD